MKSDEIYTISEIELHKRFCGYLLGKENFINLMKGVE